MGHSSIQVTVDIYGHLVPGANGKLCGSTRFSPANTRKQDANACYGRKGYSRASHLIGGPGRIRTPDQVIMSPEEGSESKQFQQDSSAKPSKSRQNTQTIRKQNPGNERSD